MTRVTILGVPIDAVTMQQAINQIQTMLRGGKHHVMTPNSEMLVRAASDDVFRSLLQKTDLNVPDSAGLLWAARYTGQHLPVRVAGVDLVTSLCAALTADQPVFLLGGQKGAGQKAAAKLKSMNLQLRIAGTYEGSPRKEDAVGIIKRINDSGAHLLLVAYGAPGQDLWINQHLLQLTSVRVAIGVGGTFDFLSGKIKRAPGFMQVLHLEWLWRLILQPWRIGRIVTATIHFPLLVALRKKS